MKIIERKEAKAQGLKRYFTGRPCKHGHVAERLSDSGGCVECKKNRSLQWSEDNPNYSQEWRADNRSRLLVYQRQWRDKNSDHARQYREENRERYRADSAHYRAAKLDRTISHEEDLTHFVMQEAAQQTKDMEEAFGMPFHVDHMTPLQSEEVSGLHVWYNLQVLPATLNVSKKSRLIYTEHLEWLADAISEE